MPCQVHGLQDLYQTSTDSYSTISGTRPVDYKNRVIRTYRRLNELFRTIRRCQSFNVIFIRNYECSDTFVTSDGRGYRIELTGTSRFARAVFVEKTYKVPFHDHWQGSDLLDLTQQLRHLFEDLLD